MILEWIRRAGYWTLDFMKGSPVRKHYKQIEYLLNHEAEVPAFQARKLEEILRFAVENTEFYRTFAGFKTLEDFPVIDKNRIKANIESFKSPLCAGKTIHMHTSGSTGTPFIVEQDPDKRNRVLAEMMTLWGRAGYRIGMRYVFFRSWTDTVKKSKLDAFMRNLVMEDIVTMDEARLEQVRSRLKRDKRIKMLLGYASTFNNLAEYLARCGDTPEMFGVRTILSGSEVLTEHTRELLKRVFGCTVVSLYSNQENGMLAIECPAHTEFHVNTASYIVELLKEDRDEPVMPGEMGRVVITDLFNRAMPLIRYDTGDLAILKNKADCAWQGQVLTSIEGRAVDVLYTTQGVKLSPHVITNHMWNFNKIKQFQIVQQGRAVYDLKVNDPDRHYADSEYMELLHQLFGQDAEINLTYVDEIPVIASGKYKYLLQNYVKEPTA